MRIRPKHIKRNFTGADLQIAEQAMQEAYLKVQDAQQAFDYSMSKGHTRYANKNHLPVLNQAKEVYQLAVDNYNNIIQAIDAANNSQLKAVQTDYVAAELQQQQSAAPKPQDYTTYIYIGIAVLVIAFFWKS
jgi:hypothetical protein